MLASAATVSRTTQSFYAVRSRKSATNALIAGESAFEIRTTGLRPALLPFPSNKSAQIKRLTSLRKQRKSFFTAWPIASLITIDRAALMRSPSFILQPVEGFSTAMNNLTRRRVLSQSAQIAATTVAGTALFQSDTSSNAWRCQRAKAPPQSDRHGRAPRRSGIRLRRHDRALY